MREYVWGCMGVGVSVGEVEMRCEMWGKWVHGHMGVSASATIESADSLKCAVFINKHTRSCWTLSPLSNATGSVGSEADNDDDADG